VVDYLLKIVSYIVLLINKIPTLSKTVNETSLPFHFIGFLAFFKGFASAPTKTLDKPQVNIMPLYNIGTH
jgi:hypothetical protein